MTNRRSLVLALTAAALTPTVTFAAEAGNRSDLRDRAFQAAAAETPTIAAGCRR